MNRNKVCLLRVPNSGLSLTMWQVMLFMKGSPDVPRCGFSRRTVALLRDQKVDFDSFDILSDESVRSGKPTVSSNLHHLHR